MTEQAIRQRMVLFQAMVVLAFAVLTVQLWRIQIGGGVDYRKLSQDNSVRLEAMDAPRGVVYDRQGRILVRNRPSFRASLVPALVVNSTWLLWNDAQWQEAADALVRIAIHLDMPFPTGDPATALRAAFDGATGQRSSEEINELCQQEQLLPCFAEALIIAPYRPVTVQSDLPREVAFRVMENGINLPGLSVVSASQREYLYGPMFAHLLGYELPIPQAMLDRQTRFSANPYLPTDRVGLAGLEAGFEEQLRGTRGARVVEHNVVGQPVRTLQEEPGTPGHNLFLTIDTELQQVVTQALQEGLTAANSPEGVAIAMNPHTGEILAMVSLPSYDNNQFVGDLDADVYQALVTDPAKPMFNRAISGSYPPGSIFKLVPAAGALADGIINRATTIFDPGEIVLPHEGYPDDPVLAMRYGTRFVCWKDDGHGDETVIEAIAHSCDVFFYEVGGGFLEEFRGLGIDALSGWASAFGLGELTGIALPGEVAGRVPTRQWKRLNYQESWLKGDTYNMSIGQGHLLVTPLQMLNATAAVANGGTLYEPQMVYQVQDAQGGVVQPFEPRVLRNVGVPLEHLATVAEGMRGAMVWDDGTARLVFSDAPYTSAGKTGTAEYCPSEMVTLPDGTLDCKRDPQGNQLTHAWFTAYAPYENPEIALIVFVHGNGETVIQGSEVAAPIARRILDFYFRERPLDPSGPVEAVPTPTPAPTLTPLATVPASGPGSQPSPVAPAPTAPALPTLPPQATATPLPPPPEPTLPPLPEPGGNGTFTGALLRTEAQGGEQSIVSGRVVDAAGSPVAGVTITLDGGGATVAMLVTGPDGSFRYDMLNASQAATWYVRAPALAGAPVIALSVSPQQHYIVLFQEGP